MSKKLKMAPLTVNLIFPETGMENKVAFEWKITGYSYEDLPDVLEDNMSPGTHLIVFEYTSMNVDINREVRMVDFNTFVSGVGGALGLFLGFSIIDTLLYFYNSIFR